METKKVATRFAGGEPRGESLRQGVPYHRAPSSGRLVSSAASPAFVVAPSSRTAAETG
jgi:hypothetical protein